MTRLTVIDHGAGNLVSITDGLHRAGAQVSVATDPHHLAGADGIVLPGVGSSEAALLHLGERGLSEALSAWTGPLLGICVGFQVLFDSSAEGPSPGLAMLPGRVERLSGTPLPHMGWNDITLMGTDPLFRDTTDGELFYFVHSYAPPVRDPDVVVATVSYEGETFVAAARRGEVVGVQFHPERSGAAGQLVLDRFVGSVAGSARAA